MMILKTAIAQQWQQQFNHPQLVVNDIIVNVSTHLPAQVSFVGKWPSKGPRGEDLDRTRRLKAGSAMADRFAVVEWRGDWILHHG